MQQKDFRNLLATPRANLPPKTPAISNHKPTVSKLLSNDYKFIMPQGYRDRASERRIGKEQTPEDILKQLQDLQKQPTDVPIPTFSTVTVDKSADEQAQEYINSISGVATEFNSEYAKTIYNLAFALQKPVIHNRKKNDLFLPGRMSFDWKLSFAQDTADLPGITINPSNDPSLNSELQDDKIIINQIQKLCRNIRAKQETAFNKDSKSMDITPPEPILKKESIPSKLQDLTISKIELDSKDHAVIEDDIDIFDDAGRDYVLEISENAAIETSTALHPEVSSIGTGYFKNLDANVNIKTSEIPEKLNDILTKTVEISSSLNIIEQQSDAPAGYNFNRQDTDMIDMDNSDMDGELEDFREIDLEANPAGSKRQLESTTNEPEDHKQKKWGKPGVKRVGKKQQEKHKLTKEFNALDKVYQTKYGTGLSKKRRS